MRHHNKRVSEVQPLVAPPVGRVGFDKGGELLRGVAEQGGQDGDDGRAVLQLLPKNQEKKGIEGINKIIEK